ncbi:Tfp pilus assembly protein PilF [Reichenbachiella faecimaris]|uniref:Tfp pilus assembly protein PilF n=1 Tax=Reichenbachiella faecimaris TaxID=692418 RepID=A0A1W2GGT1_REIFA|nr:tetratricopeptide repeat protein [Reichenbachiella faecimaris]SMD35875.1 Tfp pilus assembly protein PilF [Reichenbachiella faecimaris]
MRRLIKVVVFSLSLIVSYSYSVSQSLTSDSLKKSLLLSSSPQEKADILNLLGLRTYRSNPDSALNYIEKSLEISERINYKSGQAEHYRIKGLIKHNTGFYEESLNDMRSSLKMYRALGDSNKVGMVYKNIGWIYLEFGEFPEALVYFTKANQIADTEDDNLLKGQVLNNLGVLMALIGEYDSAMVHLLKSVEITSKNGDRLIGLTHTNIGLVKSNLGDYTSAETYFLKGLELDVLHEQQWGIANAFENIGELKLKLGMMEEAQNHFQKARDQFVELKDIKGVAVNDNFLGVILYQRGLYKEALDKLSNAYKLYQQINYQRGLAKVLRDMASCNLLIGKTDDAIKLAKESIALATEIGQIPEAVQTAEILHKIYADLGDSKNAYKQAMTFLAFKDSLYNRQKLEYITQVEAKHQLSQIQQENELLLKDNQLKINELQASNLMIERQNTIQFALVICLACALLTAFFWYRFNLRKQKTIKLLRTLNDEITRQKEQIAEQANELEKVNGEMKNMNESLEVLVMERTQKIESQNKKLRDYAFSNSHEVRAPLSNLLGLINISKIQGMSPEEQEEIIEKIYISALDLDSVITKVNKILEDEEL